MRPDEHVALVDFGKSPLAAYMAVIRARKPGTPIHGRRDQHAYTPLHLVNERLTLTGPDSWCLH